MKAMTWVYWPWYGENNQANQSKNTIACNGTPFFLLVCSLYFKLKMQTFQVKTIWSIRIFFVLLILQPITAHLGNFDCSIVLWLIQRYVEEQNWFHAVMHQCTGILEGKPNGLDFRLHGSMAFNVANTVFHRKRHTSNNTCNSNHFI